MIIFGLKENIYLICAADIIMVSGVLPGIMALAIYSVKAVRELEKVQ